MTPAAEAYLRRRRQFRIVLLSVSCLLVLSIVVSQVRAIGRPRDDWFTFNHRQFQVSAVLSGGRIEIPTPGGGNTTVSLAGVDVAQEIDERGDDIAKDYLAQRILGRTVTFLLDTPQTRDKSAQLLAYVFPSEGDNLNADLVADGLARADRHNPSPLALQIESAETGARRKGRTSSSSSAKLSQAAAIRASKATPK
jgi:endonuclease YncB( thermonuclease family)